MQFKMKATLVLLAVVALAVHSGQLSKFIIATVSLPRLTFSNAQRIIEIWKREFQNRGRRDVRVDPNDFDGMKS